MTIWRTGIQKSRVSTLITLRPPANTNRYYLVRKAGVVTFPNRTHLPAVVVIPQLSTRQPALATSPMHAKQHDELSQLVD